MRILIAETTWATMAAANDLAAEGCFVTRARDGAELLEYADLSEQNAILIDADLPDIEALACLRRLRRDHPNAAIALLAPLGDRPILLPAFEGGADAVIPYRTDPRELVARIQAVAYRRVGLASPEVEVGDLWLNVARREVTVGGRPLQLTRNEYELVETLALRSGQIVSKEAIMAQLYALDEAPDDRIIGVYICRIRQKIAAAGGDPGLVENMRGRGYAMLDTASLRIAV